MISDEEALSKIEDLDPDDPTVTVRDNPRREEIEAWLRELPEG